MLRGHQFQMNVPCKITSQELLTDHDCATESAKYVFTSSTGSHARDG